MQYRILNALYGYMREGIMIDQEAIGAEALGIPEEYRRAVITNMLEEGLVKGVTLKRYIHMDAPLPSGGRVCRFRIEYADCPSARVLD